MVTDLFRFSNAAMRRLSCIPETLSLVPQRAELNFAEQERRASQQHEIDSAMHWLERRKSVDSNGVLGQIDESLYRKRGSVVSVRGSKDSLCVGRVHMELKYNFTTSDFVVVLLEVNFDIKVEECQLIFLLGEGLRKESKKLTAGSSFPLQTFKFALSYDELLTKSLTVELVSPKSSGFGVQKHGRSIMPLSSLNPSDEILLWLELESVNEKSCGELQLYFSYLSSAERLILTVQESINLQRLDINQNAGGYIKASLIVGDKVVKKRKTSIRKATQNGFVWNEGLSFDVDSKILARCRLELVVMECDKLGNHYPIGQLIFGSTESQPTKASKLWKEALEGRTSLPQWVQLQEVKS